MVNSLILINNDEVRANALLNKFMYSRKVGVQSVWKNIYSLCCTSINAPFKNLKMIKSKIKEG